jgi:hypothetical protein
MTTSIIQPLNNILKFGKIDKKCDNFVSSCSFNVLEQFLLLVNEQKPLPDNYEMSHYVINLKNYDYVETNYNINNKEDKNYISVILDGDFGNIDIISPSTTSELLSTHTNRYLFYPAFIFNYTNKNKKINIGHAEFLLIDNIKKQILLIDPNGRNDYPFNSLVYDLILQDFTSSLNFILSDKFTYVSNKIWNENKYNLNKLLVSKLLGNNGYCSTISLILMQYLSSTGKNISEIFELFYKMCDYEFVEIISSYNNGITNLFNDK